MSTEQVLTPGAFAARQAHLAVAARQSALATGKRVWQTPPIDSLAGWLTQLWQRGRDAGLLEAAGALLTPAQQLLLWRQVIDAREGEALLYPRQAASQAAAAWSLLHAHRAADENWRAALEGHWGGDVARFRQWAGDYVQRLTEAHWTDSAAMAEVLLALLEGGDRFVREALELPDVVHWQGFVQLTPWQRRLQAALAGLGVTQQSAAPIPLASPLAGDLPKALLLAPDGEEELRAALAWARLGWREHPGGQWVVAVPNLAARRAQVVALAEEAVLLAGQQEGGQGALRYELWPPPSLAEQPLIADALALLALLDERMERAPVARVLLSAHFGGAAGEQWSRAQLAWRLREEGGQTLTARRLLHLASERDKPWHAPQLAAWLAALVSQARGWGRQATPVAWAERFGKALGRAGWPGGALTTSEAQQLEAWRDQLQQLAALQRVATQLSLAGALAHLQELGRAARSPASAQPAPLWLVDQAELAGGSYAGLWLAGLSEGDFPVAAAANPLLPLAWQRRRGVPQADIAARHPAAVAWLELMRAASGQLVASSPLQERGMEKRPASAALVRLGGTAPLPDSLAAEAAGDLLPPPAVEWLTQDAGVPLASGFSGGTTLLNDQAECPFRAYVQHRLAAGGERELRVGLDAMERGGLLHEALAALWAQIGDSATLAELDEGARRQLAQRAASRALAQVAPRRGDLLQGAPGSQAQPSPFHRQEQARLTDALLRWLAVEEQRSPPFRVVASERQARLALGKVQLKMRIDRIDAVAPEAQGADTPGQSWRHWVIDYKSGKGDTTPWYEPRLGSVQLPLYALALEDEGQPCAGVAFAVLKPGEKKPLQGSGETPFTGLSVSRKAREEPWPETLRRWRGQVGALAEEFAAGAAAVEPRKVSQTCRYCQLQGVCRIADGAPLGLIGEDDQ